MKAKSSWPLWISLITFWLVSIALQASSLSQTGGHFGYPLDDTYIHMAIARHFVTDGVWGVSATGFSSSTSSPLWTLLIATIYKIVGVNEWAPMALSFIFGNATIILCYFLLKNRTNSLRLSLFLIIIILFVPIPIISLMGMEHMLQGFLTLWLVFMAAEALSTREMTYKRLGFLLLLLILVTSTRYEGLFLVLIISILFFINKQFLYGIVTFIAGAIPIIIYGLISVSNGWNFFPNSILLKGNILSFSLSGIIRFLWVLPSNLLQAPHILLLLVAMLIVYLWGMEHGKFGRRERYLFGIYLVITLLHLQFASVGWFYRYESYLILVGWVLIVDACNLLLQKSMQGIGKNRVESVIIWIVLSILLILPLTARTGSALNDYPLAVNNIYQQQYQMGTFLRDFYKGRSVAANDIGAISYLADNKLLDLFGLGSLDVARYRRSGQLNENSISTLVRSKDVEIIVIYKSWFEGMIPPEWVEVGQWKIMNNVVCANDTVTFYVPQEVFLSAATSNLKAFSTQLPPTVVQSGIYLDQ